jgi:dsRNA-specific ribonuclease
MNIVEVEKFVKKHIYGKINSIEKKPVKSYKTLMQELAQKKYKVIPEYINIEHKIDDKKNVLEYKSELYIL